jgi:hypothetical protein
MLVHDLAPAVSPNVTAGVLLCARRIGEQLELAFPTVSAILDVTGATRTRAYEIASELREVLPTLARPVGRPAIERVASPPSVLGEIAREALRFVMAHPGCAHRGDERGRYSETWRRFVIGLVERHEDVPLPELAEALCVPLGTLDDWLRAPRSEPPEPEPPEPEPVEVSDAEHEAKLAQVEAVLSAWRAWKGSFTAFCEHVRRELRIEVGNTTIRSILFAYGERTPARRAGRSRDEEALRGTFETFFAGAQWVADGKTVEVVIDGEVLNVNLELAVDAATGAAVGIDVRDEEDSAALVAAFDDGVETTGEPPLAMLVDNRPSNHTPQVDAALGETMRIDGTPGRAQNKAHVEGAFGLFAQKVPPLEVDTSDPRALARSIALLVATTFFRALNRAPRRDRGGRSRADLYSAEHVTAEEREAARASLHERMRKQQLARETRAARVDPEMRALLDEAFERLSLLDPERRMRDVIARYPRDAVVDAVAIFGAKQQRASLPEGADARYLLGIVRNLHHEHEADALTQLLLRERIGARDRFLAPLLRARDAILTADDDLDARLKAITRHIVEAERELDRYFWIDALALIAPTEKDARSAFALRSAHRIHACFRLGTRERHRIVRLLLRRLWSLE